jgi:O-antigen/teichoic acid export membrane protein
MLKNSLGILSSRLISIAVSLVSVPVVISYLGIAGYGVWESIIAVSVICNVAQTTISGTLLWKFSGAFGSGDHAAALYYVRIGVFASLALSCLLTPIAWCGRQFLVHLFHVPAEFRSSAAVILPLVVALMVLATVTEVIGALLSGFQRAGIVNLVQSVSGACNYGVVIIGLLTGLGFWSLLLGFVTGFLVSLGVLYGIARSVCGPVSLVPRVPSLTLLRSLKGYSGFMLLHSAVGAFRDPTDRIVLASVASPIWTGYFAIAARLAQLVWMACQFLYVPVIAASGALAARSDWIGLRRLYTDTSTMLSVMVGFISVTIAALHDQLFLVWLGHSVPQAVPILYLLLLGSTVGIVLTGVGTAMCKGIGIVRMEAICIAVGLLINLVLKFAFIQCFGPIGTVVASAASMALSALLFLFLMHKRLPELPWRLSSLSIKTLLAALCSIAVLRFLLPSSQSASGRAGALLALCTMIPCVAAIYFPFLIVFRVITMHQVRHFAAKYIGGRENVVKI